jgi:hypothetical protein
VLYQLSYIGSKTQLSAISLQLSANPSAAKAAHHYALGGTAEAVPFHNHHALQALRASHATKRAEATPRS